MIGSFLSVTVCFILFDAGRSQWDNWQKEKQQEQAYIQHLEKEQQRLLTLNVQLNKELTDKDQDDLALLERIKTLEKHLELKSTESQQTLNDKVKVIENTYLWRQHLLNKVPNGSPMPHKRISSYYGRRIHPVTKLPSTHHGIDLVADIGTPIYATADGVVSTTQKKKTGYGYLLMVNHGFGFETRYAHMNKFKVKKGRFVKKGDLIGWSGNTGRSTGPHLHYEIRFLGKSLDPKRFMAWNLTNFSHLFKREPNVDWSALVRILSTPTPTPTPTQGLEGQSFVTHAP